MTDVEKQVRNVRTFLKKRFGEIEPQWEIQLSLLQSNLEAKELIDNQIKKDGILIQDRFGQMQKNSLLKTSQEMEVRIQKNLEELGASPKSQKNLKPLEDSDNGEIIKNLLG